MIGIEPAHDAQLGSDGGGVSIEFVGDAQSPAGIGEDFFDADAGMNGGRGKLRHRGQICRTPSVVISAEGPEAGGRP